MSPQIDNRVDPKKHWNVTSLAVTQILNHQPLQREQIDVGITVDVLIHFHCIFGTDRKKSRINFCTAGELLRVTLFRLQSPEDFVPIQELITLPI